MLREVVCPAPGCDGGLVGICSCDVCTGTGRVVLRPFRDVLRGVQAKLARSSVFGDLVFETARDEAGNRIEGLRDLRFCQGDSSRRHEERALYEAQTALLAAGHSVWVFRPGVLRMRASRPAEETRPPFDHEQCLHGQEPSPETLAECEQEAA